MSKNPYAGINFVKRRAVITDANGKEIFNEEAEFPDYFSDASVKIVASKYLANTSKKKEKSLKDMLNRVSDTITESGVKQGYFANEDESSDFNYKLKKYQVEQLFAFNSPVYFNVGIDENPQASACFILEVNDSMDSITDWYKNESVVFKSGSGAGANLSKIRSSKERVRGGGFASGPISFLKSSDTLAGVIKSGGTFRRSAKLACLDIEHPDIYDFMSCKDKEEEKLRLLKSSGIKPRSGYELSDEVFFQNTNISFRIPNSFMESVVENREFSTKEVLTGNIVETFNARDVLRDIAKHAWETGDPGLQYHDNTNDWHTVPSDGVIEASNPCAEFLFLNNSACNLTSLNLKKFFVNGKFLYEKYRDVIETVITAQDILVDASTYPTPEITKNTNKYRPLGMGFTNIGSLFMALGFPYDSDNARTLASGLSSLMTAICYETSKKLAKKVGAPKFWNKANGISMYAILNKHADEMKKIKTIDVPELNKSIIDIASSVWEQGVLNNIEPVRNAQATLSLPAGTVSFLMGADTTGIEPDFSLIKYKRLSGQDGATIKTVNGTVYESLINLGYSKEDVSKILSDLVDKDIPIEHSKYIKKEDIAIFDTAMNHQNGKRYIDYYGHVKMMQAVQPFISGAISKTINMPNDCTVEDVYDLYLYSWKVGLKSIAIYRDGSKTDQVMSSTETTKQVDKGEKKRKKLPTDRIGSTHKFYIGQVEGYLTHNTWENGELAEFFISISKDGSTLRGLVDSIATITSIALQSGVPLRTLVDKMINRKFEPAGFTRNENIRSCSSIIDYVFRFLGQKYLSIEDQEELGLIVVSTEKNNAVGKGINLSTEPCPKCGALMRRLGSCQFCAECGFSGGACG